MLEKYLIGSFAVSWAGLWSQGGRVRSSSQQARARRAEPQHRGLNASLASCVGAVTACHQHSTVCSV